MSWTDKEAGRARPASGATDNFAVSKITTGGSGSPCRSGRPGGPSLPARAAVLLVKGYQKLISPWLGQRCRFHPSCSNYCIDALHQHGMVIGLWLGVKRICKCHPFHPGGFDPVPRRTNARSSCGFPPQRTPRTTEKNPTFVNSSDAGGE